MLCRVVIRGCVARVVRSAFATNPIERIEGAPIECPRTARQCVARCPVLDYCCRRRADMELTTRAEG